MPPSTQHFPAPPAFPEREKLERSVVKKRRSDRFREACACFPISTTFFRISRGPSNPHRPPPFQTPSKKKPSFVFTPSSPNKEREKPKAPPQKVSYPPPIQPFHNCIENEIYLAWENSSPRAPVAREREKNQMMNLRVFSFVPSLSFRRFPLAACRFRIIARAFKLLLP